MTEKIGFINIRRYHSYKFEDPTLQKAIVGSFYVYPFIIKLQFQRHRIKLMRYKNMSFLISKFYICLYNVIF